MASRETHAKIGDKMAKAPTNPLKNIKAYRLSRGENQTQFWTRFGVTQSGGSRYESGRELPVPVAMLVLAYAEGLLDERSLEKLRRKVV
jgi:transcriptional regulator with XRE-family HTH domain